VQCWGDIAMSHQRDARDVYRQRAEACLAVLTKTTNPTSQAMLAAMVASGEVSS
jgi:hypothetical protein